MDEIQDLIALECSLCKAGLSGKPTFRALDCSFCSPTCRDAVVLWSHSAVDQRVLKGPFDSCAQRAANNYVSAQQVVSAASRLRSQLASVPIDAWR